MTHCAICKGAWTEETGVLVGHPVELHVCGSCFEETFEPIVNRVAPARPTEGPCLVSWIGYGVRFGVPVPVDMR
jgi:hypothetical protein